MKHPKSVFLLDFDLTLFNGVQYRKQVEKKFSSIHISKKQADDFFTIEQSLRGEEHHVVKAVKEFCEKYHLVDKREFVFEALLQHPFDQMLFKDVKKELKKMREIATTIVFSQGNLSYQTVKVFQSGAAELVDHIELFENKIAHLKQVIHQYRKDKQDVYYFDDKKELLEEAKKQYPKLITVHVVRFPFRKQAELPFKPDYEVESLTEFLAQFKNNPSL